MFLSFQKQHSLLVTDARHRFHHFTDVIQVKEQEGTAKSNSGVNTILGRGSLSWFGT